MQSLKTGFLLALQATDKHADGLLYFSCVWPCIKKITIFWTGAAPILVVPCERGLRDITQYCISVLSTKTCGDNWLNQYVLGLIWYVPCTYIAYTWTLCIYMYIRCTWVLPYTTTVYDTANSSVPPL